MPAHPWTRRRMVVSALGGVLTAPFARAAWAGSRDAAGGTWIELVNTHTNEVASVTFRGAAGFIEGALARLEYLLRDHRTGERHSIDPALYVLLSDLAAAAGCEPRYAIISGYRSPATNEMLRRQGRGVSKRSLHMEGRALDVRLEGCPCARLRDLAVAMGRGGVGYYPRSDFVHLDTGRVRAWEG